MIVKKEFIFIRHGESEGNLLKICQGQMEYPLTVIGREQALAAAKKLKHFLPIRKLFTSDLGRAFETAMLIKTILNIDEIILVPSLRERSWGVLEGGSNMPMFAQEEKELCCDFVETQEIDGLELKSNFLSRIEFGMNSILESSERAVIVSHGRFFFSMCDLLAIPPIKQIKNGSLLHCIPCSRKWIVNIL